MKHNVPLKLLLLLVMVHLLIVNFFRMHFGLTHGDELNADPDAVYSTIIFFSEDKRYIYLISGPPRLLKTARNCLNNSGSGIGTRFMWSGGLFLIWNHIGYIFLEDQESGLHLLPKISYEYVYLTPYSVSTTVKYNC